MLIKKIAAIPATEPNHPPQTPNLTFSENNEQEIRKIIDSLKSKSSAGDDEISSKIIKQCIHEIITSDKFHHLHKEHFF